MDRITLSARSRRVTGLLKRLAASAALALLAALLASGCGNPVDRLLADEELRAQLLDQIAGNGELAGQVVDRLLLEDPTRDALIARLMGDTEARQAILTLVARDRTMMDGAINFAVQDPAMREHLTTLFKGMAMAEGQ